MSVLLLAARAATEGGATIDRQALVSRHHPVLRGFDTSSPLSVGNAELAFTADATGLQTFAEAYDEEVPLATLAQWGWHSAPNPNGWSIDRFRFTEFEAGGRKVGYADIPGDQRTPEIEWLRQNPHRLHLGQIGFRLRLRDGREATRDDVEGIEQVLDLWQGVLRSRFRLDGEEVVVETLCHPRIDAIAVRVASPLVGRGQIAIRLRFPYGSGGTTAADWTRPEAHETTMVRSGVQSAALARRLDDDRYDVRLAWAPAGRLAEQARHAYVLSPGGSGDRLEAVVAFAPTSVADALPGFDETRRAAREHWSGFWSTGGAVDLSQSRDPRWRELERRVVLSQYLTAIQCAGRYPPQESGLTFNSWYGKFHLEMHWWHAAHFALWGRLPLLERSLGYYDQILPRARATAARQGYTGARWPKMTDPSGAESPSSVGPFLVWQQPHPIYYAELVYRERKDRATLERFKDVVHETAEFMASFPTWDEAGGRYVLGPPLQGAQEIFPKDSTVNSAFELAYWRWGLETAQHWRERLGLAREPRWQRVLERLSPMPVRDGRYLFAETAPDSFSDPRWVARPPVGHGRPRRAARARGRSGDDAPDLRLGLGALELAGHVGLGLPDARHVRRAPRRPQARGRRAADGRGQERVSAERPQPPAPRPHDLPAWKRRAAHGGGDDGGGLGRSARPPRAGLPERRKLDRAVRRPAPDAVIAKRPRRGTPR